MKLFALNEIKNESWHFRGGDKIVTRKSLVAEYFLSQDQSDFDDEAGNPF